MKSAIRTFIAIKIVPENELKSFIGKAKIAFNDESIKWVDENNLHLTLRFLGQTSAEQVKKITRSLEKIAFQTGRFPVQLKGAGYFKSNRAPKVLFVDINDAESLKELAMSIDEEVVMTGFEPENRKFNPHLTLARIKFIKNIESFLLFIKDWKEKEFQTVQVTEIIYYQSILNSDEPVYKPLGKFKLK